MSGVLIIKMLNRFRRPLAASESISLMMSRRRLTARAQPSLHLGKGVSLAGVRQGSMDACAVQSATPPLAPTWKPPWPNVVGIGQWSKDSESRATGMDRSSLAKEGRDDSKVENHPIG